MIRKLALAFSVGAVALITGCTTAIHDEERTRPLISGRDKRDYDNIDPLRPALFLRTYSDGAGMQTQPVRLRGAVPLAELIATAAPGYVAIPQDGVVDMYRPVQFSSSSMPLSKFLETLSGLTGYDLHLNGQTIEVAAYVSREWSLSMFASKMDAKAEVSGSSGGATASGGGSGNNNNNSNSGGGNNNGGGGGNGGTRSLGANMSNEIDEWKTIVDHVKTLLGVGESAAGAVASIASSTTDSTGAVSGGDEAAIRASLVNTPTVVENRSVGYIRAYGDARKIRAVDAYIAGLVKQARKQVRLDVRSIEVSFSNSRARGINWDAALKSIFDGARGVAGITLGADYAQTGSLNDGSLSIGGQAASVDDSISAAIKLLASYGHVELTNKPEVTVFNGRTAYIGSGEEFGYVASVTQNISNGLATVTSEISRILIGVELSITARVLDGDNIMLEIVPVVSTLTGFDNFDIATAKFSQPRIVLNQLSTTVVVPSGKPIHLGGLVTSKINEATRGLPLKEGGILSQVLGPVFSGDSNTIDRRELILVVTPYLSNV